MSSPEAALDSDLEASPDSVPVVPPEGTIEGWAWAYLHAPRLVDKLTPPSPPSLFETGAPSRRIQAPSRPAPLVIQKKGLRNTRSGALKDPERRAEILHTFLHHELQAAELMGWALLFFPETPEEFRRGLLRIATDEIRHMGMYQRELERLGYTFGDFPVNDWFWERVPGATTPAHYVAAMGMGFEGGNLDHAQRFEDRFRAAGDDQAANTQAIVAADEQAHVAFALRWFSHFTGGQDFDEWHRHLPEPLSPLLMRGRPMNVPARRSAGFSEAFLARLSQW